MRAAAGMTAKDAVKRDAVEARKVEGWVEVGMLRQRLLARPARRNLSLPWIVTIEERSILRVGANAL